MGAIGAAAVGSTTNGRFTVKSKKEMKLELEIKAAKTPRELELEEELRNLKAERKQAREAAKRLKFEAENKAFVARVQDFAIDLMALCVKYDAYVDMAEPSMSFHGVEVEVAGPDLVRLRGSTPAEFLDFRPDEVSGEF